MSQHVITCVPWTTSQRRSNTSWALSRLCTSSGWLHGSSLDSGFSLSTLSSFSNLGKREESLSPVTHGPCQWKQGGYLERLFLQNHPPIDFFKKRKCLVTGYVELLAFLLYQLHKEQIIHSFQPSHSNATKQTTGFWDWKCPKNISSGKERLTESHKLLNC